MKTVFIVDDNDSNLMSAKNALMGTYKTYGLPSAARMFKLAEKIIPDIILLDVEMPEMDGFETMEALKLNNKLKNCPVIFLTANQDTETEIRGFEIGALDFITKPFSPPVLLRRIATHIETDRLIKESLRAVQTVHNATISVIADMVESRDKVTGGHIERTQKYLGILVDALLCAGIYTDTMSDWDISLLLPSSQLHDVGKIVISDLILNKPGKLTNEEFDIIKQHCVEGKRIIDRIVSKTKNDDFLSHANQFAISHHEKWNGTGYPNGFRGEEIPLEGRLMAIVDVYDALVSERPYKKPYSHEQAVEVIKKDSGMHFDPKIVEVFINVADDFIAKIS